MLVRFFVIRGHVGCADRRRDELSRISLAFYTAQKDKRTGGLSPFLTESLKFKRVSPLDKAPFMQPSAGRSRRR